MTTEDEEPTTEHGERPLGGAEEGLLAQVLEQLSEAILITDLEGRILRWLGGAEQIFGFSAQEAVGKPIQFLYRADIRKTATQEIVSAIQRTGRFWSEIPCIRKDGIEIPIDITVKTICDKRGNPLCLVAINRDISERKTLADSSAEGGQRFLAKASAVFSSSLDYQKTIASVVRLAVPEIADWCAVDMVSEDGHVERLAVAHTDPSKEPLAWDWWRRFPADPDDPTSVISVARTRKSTYFPEITDGMLVANVKDAELLDVLRKLGLHSTICVPLYVRERSLGTLSLISSDSRRVFRPSDVLLAEDLARRAAVAIDNAQLYREVEFQRFRLASMLEQLPAVISVTRGPKHVCEAVNLRVWELLGDREIIGRSVAQAYPELVDLAPLSAMNHVFSTGEVVSRTEIAITAGWGDTSTLETKFFNTVMQPMRNVGGGIDGVMTFSYEVTEQVRSRKILVAMEKRTAFLAQATELMSSSLDYEATLRKVAQLAVPTLADVAGVYVADPDGSIRQITVTHVDPAKEHLVWELYRIIPMRIDQDRVLPKVIRTGQAVLLEDIPNDVRSGWTPSTRAEELVEHLVVRSYMVVPLVLRGRVFGALALSMADSGRTFSEDDFALAKEVARRAAISIENANLYREAQEANRLKDEFLTTISHELRTPLHAVLGWAKMLRTNLSDPSTFAKGLATIERNALAQAKLVEELLDMNKIVSGKLLLKVRRTDIVATVLAALESIRPSVSTKGLLLETSLDPNAGVIVADPDRIQQVMFNLLTNAVKFTSRGGLISVEVHRHGSHVLIKVTDAGKGIPRAFLPHVFERFRQADQTITRTFGGLGLGLAIVKHIVELHGGVVQAYSEGEGKGATFTIILPIAAVDIGADESRKPAMQPMTGAALDGLKVLVVDDEHDAAELVAFVLGTQAADVRFVLSAQDALTALHEFQPHVLVSDIGLPNVNGYDLLRDIRLRGPLHGGHVPAIALTAYAHPEERNKAFAAGFQIYLTKPVDPDELVAAVASLTGRPFVA